MESARRSIEFKVIMYGNRLVRIVWGGKLEWRQDEDIKTKGGKRTKDVIRVAGAELGSGRWDGVRQGGVSVE